jgi:hypothetical protein
MAPRKITARAARDRAVRIVGRPRKVTVADIAEILAWHASRETCAEVAKRLGLSQATIRRVVRTRGGHYKKPPPDGDEEASIPHIGCAGTTACPVGRSTRFTGISHWPPAPRLAVRNYHRVSGAGTLTTRAAPRLHPCSAPSS